MSKNIEPKAEQPVKWSEIPRSALQGHGLEPYPASDFSTLFDWSEKTGTSSVHVMPYAGQFLVDVVEIEDNAVHQPSKPDDEIVCILNGVLRLVTDDTGTTQSFEAGDMVLIPAGWAGVYRVESRMGPFRELCIVPHDYFDPSIVPPPSGLLPRPIEHLTLAGTNELLKTRYSIIVERHDTAKEWEIDAVGDVIIRVLSGKLVLETDGETGSFSQGDFVVVPKGFAGKACASEGYQSLTARWLG
jgi:uncharacterized cupin superfamily protein